MKTIEKILALAAIIGLLYACFARYKTIDDTRCELEEVREEMKELSEELRDFRYLMMLYWSGKPVERNVPPEEIVG